MRNKIIQGDTLAELKKLPSDSVDMVITSPPYFGLRNYGIDGQIGLEDSFTDFLQKILSITTEIKRVLKPTGQFWLNFGDCYASAPAGNKTISEANEGTDGLYVRKAKMGKGAQSFVDTLGRFDKDTYLHKSTLTNPEQILNQGHSRCADYPEKCMLMQPERLAIKMIDEQGWILRNKIKWAKQVYIKKENRTIGSVMPTSVKDRFNESGEELYFFVKSKKYYSDLDAVRLKNQVLGVTDFRAEGFVHSAELYYDSKYANAEEGGKIDGASRYKKQDNVPSRNAQTYKGFNERWKKSLGERMEDTKNKNKKESPNYNRKKLLSEIRLGIKPDTTHTNGKNLPSVWLVQPEPHNYRKELQVDTDHFAAFPQALCEIPILFGCPQWVCVKCGKARERITEIKYEIDTTGGRGNKHKDIESKTGAYLDNLERKASIHNTLGWSDCQCGVGFIPGTILDPFCGSGTVAVVAKRFKRNFIGVELNPKYVALAEKRLSTITPPLL